MDNGGIWPGDEYYFESLKEKSYEERIKEITKELADKDRQLTEARAEIESLTRSLTIVANWENINRTYTADEVKEFARGILDVAAIEAAERLEK